MSIDYTLVKKILWSISGTTVILSGIYLNIDTKKLLLLIQNVDWLSYCMIMMLVCVSTLVVDVISFGSAYKRHLLPGMETGSLLFLRGSILLAVSTLPPAAPLVSLAYFKNQGINFTRTVSVELLVASMDIIGCITILTVSLLLMPAAFNWIGVISIIGFWCLFTGGVFAFKKNRTSLSKHSLFAIMKQLDSKDYSYLYSSRLSLALVHLVALSFLLNISSIELSLTQLMIFSPLFVASAFLPISAGGYGGPQGAAVLLLVYNWELASIESAIAFSVLWSTLFLIGRVTIGGLITGMLWQYSPISRNGLTKNSDRGDKPYHQDEEVLR
ncbi:hypothetical protein A9Q99_00040 [Gammaproteobacteria bacterium 45_16_T64]|nr:hypothetical protein A9Q99_00040 [Gammaproteobacteria bacterium 45_16_T64]